MTARRLLLLDANHLTAYVWRNGHVNAEGEFSANPAGFEAFGNYLAKYRKSLFYLLADVAEEGFQIDDVPYVTGKDRSALLKRRLGQYYYGTPYAAAISLGREKTGRKDEKILFAALTRPPHIDPWMACLGEAQAQLAGLHSMPLVIAQLFKGLPEFGAGPALLLTMGRGGLRQTFFDKGQFRFSRLTPLATGSLDEFAAACSVESDKIYQYLVGQRLVERGVRLQASILIESALTENFQKNSRGSADIVFNFIGLDGIAKKRGLKSPSAHQLWADNLFLHSLIRNAPSQQFAPEEALRSYRIWQAKAAIDAFSIIGFSACLMLSTKYALGVYSLLDRATQVDAETASDKQRYEAMLKTLPPMPMKVDELRSLMNRVEEMERRSPQIADTYRRISRALDASPEVNLQRVDWALSGKPEGAANTAFPGGYFVLADLQAELPVAMVSDHRRMLDAVERFAADLRKDDGLDVKIVRMPFDTESGKTIHSSGDAPTAQADAPTFAIHIVQRVF